MLDQLKSASHKTVPFDYTVSRYALYDCIYTLYISQGPHKVF